MITTETFATGFTQKSITGTCWRGRQKEIHWWEFFSRGRQGGATSTGQSKISKRWLMSSRSINNQLERWCYKHRSINDVKKWRAAVQLTVFHFFSKLQWDLMSQVQKSGEHQRSKDLKIHLPSLKMSVIELISCFWLVEIIAVCICRSTSQRTTLTESRWETVHCPRWVVKMMLIRLKEANWWKPLPEKNLSTKNTNNHRSQLTSQAFTLY